MPTRRRGRKAPERTLDANQVVAYNFRAARELRGWTQDQAARQLEPYLGHQLPKASISAIERSVETERRRQFDAQKLVAFALGFDLPVVWFLLPPPDGAGYRLAGTTRDLTWLVALVFGKADHQEAVRERIGAIRRAAGEARTGDVLARAAGLPAEVSWEQVARGREDALFELVEAESSELERLVGDLRRVLDRFEGLSVRAFLEAHPRRVYREGSHALLGERVWRRVLRDAEPGRYTMVPPMLSDANRAVEDAIDVDDPVIVGHLAAVFDRVEERLREDLRENPPPWMGPAPDEE